METSFVNQYLAHIAYRDQRIWFDLDTVEFITGGQFFSYVVYHCHHDLCENVSMFVFVRSVSIHSVLHKPPHIVVGGIHSSEFGGQAMGPPWPLQLSMNMSFRKSQASVNECVSSPSCWKTTMLLIFSYRGCGMRNSCNISRYGPQHTVSSVKKKRPYTMFESLYTDINLGTCYFQVCEWHGNFSAPCDDVHLTTDVESHFICEQPTVRKKLCPTPFARIWSLQMWFLCHLCTVTVMCNSPKICWSHMQ